MPCLPIECLELIVDEVHNLATLFALLTVSRDWLHIAASRLYRDPFGWIALSRDVRRALRSFVRVVLASASPPTLLVQQPDLTSTGRHQRGHTYDVLQALQSHPAIQKTQPLRTIDYFSFVRRWVLPPLVREEVYEYLGEGSLGDWLGVTLGIPYSETDAQVASSLAWAVLVRHPTCRPEAIEVVAWDMKRWCEDPEIAPHAYPKLEHVQEIVLDFFYSSNHAYEARWTPVTEQALQATRFIRQFVEAQSRVAPRKDYHPSLHGLQNVSIVSAVGPRKLAAIRELEYEIFSLLPPPPPPTTLTDINWCQIMSKYGEVDLSAVTKLEFFELNAKRVHFVGGHTFSSSSAKKPGLWPARQSQLLQQCRSLQEIQTRVWEADIFQWAVDEKSQWQLLNGSDGNGGISTSSGTDHHDHDHDHSSRLLSLVPLKSVDLVVDEPLMHHVVQSTMVAFSSSLRRAQFSFRSVDTEDENSLSIGQGWPALPALESLFIASSFAIELDPYALDHAPRLKSLKLYDLSTDYHGAQFMTHFEPWRFQNLQTLLLHGHTAAAFHPESFASMPQLQSVELESSGDGERYPVPPPPIHDAMAVGSSGVVISTMEDILIQQQQQRSSLWRWDWSFPVLTRLQLSGEPAIHFKFEMLRHSPSLESLELNVGDRCRTLLPGYDTTTTTPLLLSSPTTVLASETHVSHSTLSHGRSGGDDLLPTNMSLNSLKLVGRWLLSRASLEQIVTMCPNVETLSLMVTDGIAPEDILRMYQQHGHRLPRLKLVELPQELPEELQHTFGVIGIEDSPDFQEPLVEFMFYDELYGFSA